MAWVKARIEVAHDDVERETAFWTGVVGGPLPEYLTVQMPDPPWSYGGALGVVIEVVRDSPKPATPPPASFPGVRRTRVYQVCADIPSGFYEFDAETWARSVGGHLAVLERRPEFAWVRVADGPLPLELLTQRLDRAGGGASAHLDVGTTDREAEVRRHVGLGATVVAQQEFWTVLSDPVGYAYCVTDRDPATGDLV